MGRAANVGVVSALILSKSSLSLARVCGDLLPAIRRSKEALAEQQMSKILDLMNLILGGLSSRKDERHLLMLVRSIKAMSCCALGVMTVERWDEATIQLLDKNITDSNRIPALSLKGSTHVHEASVELDDH